MSRRDAATAFGVLGAIAIKNNETRETLRLFLNLRIDFPPKSHEINISRRFDSSAKGRAASRGDVELVNRASGMPH